MKTKETIHTIQQHDKYKFDVFETGDKVHVRYYSDVEPATVIKVSPNGKRIQLRIDSYKLAEGQKPEIMAGGFAGHCTNQSELKYDITEDPNGKVITASLKKWRGRYCWTHSGGEADGIQRVKKGWAAFYDYNF